MRHKAYEAGQKLKTIDEWVCCLSSVRTRSKKRGYKAKRILLFSKHKEQEWERVKEWAREKKFSVLVSLWLKSLAMWNHTLYALIRIFLKHVAYKVYCCTQCVCNSDTWQLFSFSSLWFACFTSLSTLVCVLAYGGGLRNITLFLRRLSVSLSLRYLGA